MDKDLVNARPHTSHTGLPVHEGSAERAGKKTQVHRAGEPPLTDPPRSKQRCTHAHGLMPPSAQLLDRNHYPHFTNEKAKQLVVGERSLQPWQR